MRDATRSIPTLTTFPETRLPHASAGGTDQHDGIGSKIAPNGPARIVTSPSMCNKMADEHQLMLSVDYWPLSTSVGLSQRQTGLSVAILEVKLKILGYFSCFVDQDIKHGPQP